MRLSFWLDDVYKGGTVVNIKKRYLTDNTLRKYVELCYSNDCETEVGIGRIPDYNQDTAPTAYMPSNLEKQYRKFSRAIHEAGVELPIEKAERMLVQICESISVSENKFLQEVMDGNISFLPKKLMEQYDAV